MKTHFTDGEPVVTNPNDGMIQLLADQVVKKRKSLKIFKCSHCDKTNVSAPFDLKEFGENCYQNGIAKGRAEMLNEIAGREIELIDEAKRRRECQTTES